MDFLLAEWGFFSLSLILLTQYFRFSSDQCPRSLSSSSDKCKRTDTSTNSRSLMMLDQARSSLTSTAQQRVFLKRFNPLIYNSNETFVLAFIIFIKTTQPLHQLYVWYISLSNDFVLLSVLKGCRFGFFKVVKYYNKSINSFVHSSSSSFAT